MYLVIVDMMMHLSFGKYLYPIFEFIQSHVYMVGCIGFLYGCVLFYGTACAKKSIPKEFNDFVFKESSRILKEDSSVSIEKLSKEIYKRWVAYVPDLPKKYKVPSPKGWWICAPTAEMLDKELGMNKEAIVEMFENNTQTQQEGK